MQTFFSSQGRPHSAWEAYGRWEPGIKDHSIEFGDRRFPALFLGSLKLYVVHHIPMAELYADLLLQHNISIPGYVLDISERV